jgi:hypothetical protein
VAILSTGGTIQNTIGGRSSATKSGHAAAED